MPHSSFNFKEISDRELSEMIYRNQLQILDYIRQIEIRTIDCIEQINQNKEYLENLIRDTITRSS